MTSSPLHLLNYQSIYLLLRRNRSLLISSRVEAADEFQKILSLVKNNETKLESLTQAVEHLRQAHLSVVNNQAYSNFQQLLTVDSQARCAIYQDHILNSLKFDEMYFRYEAVHVAHADTFNWIYEALDTVQGGDSSRSLQFSWDSHISRRTREVLVEVVNYKE